MNKATGTVVFVGDLETFGKQYQKQQFAIRLDDSSELAFYLEGRDVEEIPRVEQLVEVSYSVESRFWDGKSKNPDVPDKAPRYFTELKPHGIDYPTGEKDLKVETGLAEESNFGSKKTAEADDIPF